MNKKPLLIALFALIFTALYQQHLLVPPSFADTVAETRADSGDAELRRAFEQQTSNLQVQGQGSVVKVLPDDNRGSRHQKFLLRLASGQTVLVAHNIDLASKIEDLKTGDTVGFSGEYEWNPKGGTVHWTHHDPRGFHEAGWLKHNGKTYQ